MTVTILITSIGSISATGVALCLAPVRQQVRIVATNSIPEAAGNFLADRTVLVPPTADAEAWSGAIRALIAAERPRLVLNGRDEEVGLLAGLREEAAAAGTAILAPPPPLVPVFADKYESARFAAAHDLPFAATAVTAAEVEALLSRTGLPVVAKPRRGGFGARGAALLLTGDDVASALAEERYVFQEMLPSPLLAASIEAWRGGRGIPWSFAMQSIDHEVDVLVDEARMLGVCLSAGHADGAFNRDIRAVDVPSMAAAAEAYGRVLGGLGYRGPVNLQGRLLDDGRFVPFEINARFTGTMIGKAGIGFNLVLAALRHWTGGAAAGDPPLAPNRRVVQRLPMFMAYDADAEERLGASGSWTRDGED